MLEQLFDNLRKASESSLQMQQDVFRQWTQQLMSMSSSPNAAGAPTEFGRTVQKRMLELTVELLNRQRESIDSAYKTAIQAIEQTYRVSEAKSSEDYRRMVEDMWRKMFETFKEQSETQFRDFQKWSEKSAEMVQKAQA